MKKILLVLLLLLLLPISISAKEKYEFKDGILYSDGKKVTGTFELISGKNKAKGSFVNGLPDGIFERYYPDGSIMLKNTFVAGIRMTEETYYKGGKLFIKFSKKDDSLKVFYEDGNLVLSRSIKTGIYIIYHENGKPLMVSNGNISTLYNENNEILFKLNGDESLDNQGDLEELKDGWGKGSFPDKEATIKYHYNKHKEEVGADSLLQYLRKAKAFSKNLRGAKKREVTGATKGVIKYEKMVNI